MAGHSSINIPAVQLDNSWRCSGNVVSNFSLSSSDRIVLVLPLKVQLLGQSFFQAYSRPLPKVNSGNRMRQYGFFWRWRLLVPNCWPHYSSASVYPVC
jgi:hypothetical protein